MLRQEVEIWDVDLGAIDLTRYDALASGPPGRFPGSGVHPTDENASAGLPEGRSEAGVA